MSLPAELDDMYRHLGRVAAAQKGPTRLGDLTHQAIPARGVYFIFDKTEQRSNGQEPRLVRVGTHCLTPRAQSTLWGRLRQHRGPGHGGGNHRGSVFRLHVGAAMIRAGLHAPVDSWGVGSNAPAAVRQRERGLEIAVSTYLRELPVVWLEVPDPPGPESQRGLVERGAIALLAAGHRALLDPPSQNWLGNWALAPPIRASGLWNVRHTDAAGSELLGRDGVAWVKSRLVSLLIRTAKITFSEASRGLDSRHRQPVPPGSRPA